MIEILTRVITSGCEKKKIGKLNRATKNKLLENSERREALGFLYVSLLFQSTNRAHFGRTQGPLVTEPQLQFSNLQTDHAAERTEHGENKGFSAFFFVTVTFSKR